jgi:hypothetical protein
MITAPPVSDIIRVMRERSYGVFENKNGYDLNIVGINIHRSNAHRPSTLVGKWSAGCQVLQDPVHFNFLLELCETAAARYSNSFYLHFAGRGGFLKDISGGWNDRVTIKD